MSRNGSGVYSLPPGSVIANGQTSDATDLNTPLADIASDLNVARPVVAGGTGAANASDARDNLGVTTALAGKQDADDTLTSIAALGTAADKLAYTTGVDTWAETDLTAAGRALLDDADAEAQRATLNVAADSADTDLANDPDAAARRDLVVGYVEGRRFSSSGQTITTNGSLTVAHGLGESPKRASAWLKCVSADQGYSVGDEIFISTSCATTGTLTRFNTLEKDATNLYVYFSNQTNCYIANPKGGNGAAGGLINANWELYLEASL